MAIAASELSSRALVAGRYRLVRPLGSGGSGSVWLAHDEDGGLEVALKIVPREGKAGSRAEREAAAAARLRHERCQRAYAMASDEDHVYIAYQYIRGVTLRHALREGALDDAAAVEAIAQVLDGLAYAHTQGIVHRDVKPTNVMLEEAEGVAIRLLDFGLASFAEADTLTAVGDVPGTLAYISPERLRGEAATPAADVWAAGVMLWEALAGRHPLWTTSPLDTARKIEEGAPPLARARPDLPKALLQWAGRALAANPARRPSAAKLAAGLRRAAAERSPARRRKKPPPTKSVAVVATRAERAVAAGLGAVGAAWSAAALPFYPIGSALVLAVVAGAAVYFRPRIGLALFLAVPFLPLGNFALAPALLYAVVAAGVFAVSWPEPRKALLIAAGPLLATVGLIGLLPLAAWTVRSGARRAIYAALAVAAAAVSAALRGASLPLTSVPGPPSLGIAGSEDAGATARALAEVVSARPGLIFGAAALIVGSVVLPHAAQRGHWAIAAYGIGLLALALAPAPQAPALALVVTTWATCIALSVRHERLSPADGRARARPSAHLDAWRRFLGAATVGLRGRGPAHLQSGPGGG